MKGVLCIAFLPALGFLLVSCSTSEEACMQECGSINLKSQNMCALENENDYSDELECSIKANQATNVLENAWAIFNKGLVSGKL